MAQEKKENQVGDVVLVHLNEQPAGYARLEGIRRHDRPGWYECDLLFLSQPPQPVTWVLEREQIDGVPFTMGGRPVKLERLPEPGAVHAERGDVPVPDEAVPKPPDGPRKRTDNVVRLVPKSTNK